MFFTLFGWRKASKCKNLIKQVQRRINLLQTKRHAIVRQLREDVALLIKAGHENIAFNRAEILFKDENIVAIYELLDGFCEFIITNLSYIRWNKCDSAHHQKLEPKSANVQRMMPLIL